MEVVRGCYYDVVVVVTVDAMSCWDGCGDWMWWRGADVAAFGFGADGVRLIPMRKWFSNDT
jgi:hypothetical protein